MRIDLPDHPVLPWEDTPAWMPWRPRKRRVSYRWVVDHRGCYCKTYWEYGPPPREFKPQVIYMSALGLTQMVLEDTAIVWCPWGSFQGHAVDCGYSFDDRLVAVQIWDDVRTRPQRPLEKNRP